MFTTTINFIIRFVAMSFFKTINNNIYIWKNDDTVDSLLGLINEKEKHQKVISKYKSEERKKQYLTTRLLVQQNIGSFEIKKGNNFKPFINNKGIEVSFTHNKEYTALITNDKPCGIDIQKLTEKVLKVKHKFINKNDFCYHSNDIETLSKAWSCKEAAFKKFGEHEIFLKSNIDIVKHINSEYYQVRVHYDQEEHLIELAYKTLGDNYLFYTIN